MSVIIEPEESAALVRRDGRRSRHAARPAAEDVPRVWPVDKKVGNVRNDGPELLIEPREPQEAALF